MLRSCCSISKLSKREEQYHIKRNDCGKYSWDKEKRNPADYRFVNLCDEIAIKSDGEIAGEQFTVESCKDCCILLLDHLATVNIDDCEECLIVTGPCSGSVFIRDCKNTSLFTVCQQFRSRNCINIDVFLFCTTKPIIESSKSMRFRSLALSYNKLEEHMMKASLSPFINNWSSVHDFTPGDVSNFEIHLTEYDKINKMDMIKHIESVKFTAELSLLPLYNVASNITGKKMLILFMKRDNEALASFYSRVLKFLNEILTRDAKLITTKDMIIRKRELRFLFMLKKYAKSFDRLVTLEIAWNREKIEESVRAENGMVEIVEDSDFEHYRTNIYQFAQMQIDTC
ncbi:unnamed protein product [Litomosoides sigmodontis]|uniref:C-CAP/cofactor C-like domain-containing protein n=1 Tax=Litomosoides sigmodontis TaxID=42156 RepID=A0A3P6SNK3_LITSI|nr:unnamed protein product [Litomosoides sigmodontis]